ncbi:MAG: hypothetical protein ACYDFU_07170 [Nitrospirota bacterium]
MKKFFSFGTGVFGCFSAIILYGGMFIIHLFSCYIVFLKYGFLGAFISFCLPVMSTLYVVILSFTWGIYSFIYLLGGWILFLLIMGSITFLFGKKAEAISNEEKRIQYERAIDHAKEVLENEN